ncbi:MAG: ATP synthase F1 subunit gamma [Phycisphaeraceae bacterium]|nr:ATP synthase F1 subunit gamma [Phycisphaeraceae bacterium]
MAGKTREIRGRMKAVGNIRRITKTMQMIATARFQAMQKRAVNAQAYTRSIARIASDLAASLAGQEVSNPLLSAPQPKAGRQLLLVISSNRGLCGAYNANVLRASTAFIRRQTEPLDVEVVGKKGTSFFRFNKISAKSYSHFGDTPRYEDVVELAQQYMEQFTAGKYDAIHVAFMSFESASRQTATITQLLPMQPPAQETRNSKLETRNLVYEFSPGPAELLSDLLPVTVKATLFQCFNEAVVSEQVSRMVAMKSATDAGEKMGKSLQRRYNRARQTAITTELSEIIGGSATMG